MVYLILTNADIYAQSEFFNFKRINIKESIEIEEKFRTKEFLPKIKPLDYKQLDCEKSNVFHRGASYGFPQAYVEYYCNGIDSTVIRIVYNWKIHDGHGDLISANNHEITYDQLNEKFAKMLGQSIESDDSQKEVFIENQKLIRSEKYISWKYRGCKITTRFVWLKGSERSLTTEFQWE